MTSLTKMLTNAATKVKSPAIQKPADPARPPAIPDEVAFKKIDGNGDGRISKDEWIKSGGDAKAFAQAEGKPGSGMKLGEYTQLRQAQRDFYAKDRNHDGKLSVFELATPPGGRLCVVTGADYKRHDMADANNDGGVTQDEFVASQFPKAAPTRIDLGM